MSDDQGSQEKRRFHRVLFDSSCSIKDNGSTVQARLIDLSLNGALINKPEGWQASVGSECTVTLPLDEGSTIIEMQVRVAHIGDEHIGLQCLHIDVESISYLRRLVELNLGDMNLLERDLAALME